LAKLKRENKYNDLDKVFRLKISVAELIILYEVGDIDLFDYQIKNIKHDFKTLLERKGYQRENLFIKVLTKLDAKKAEEEIKSFLSLSNKEDNNIINYNHWLKSKLK